MHLLKATSALGKDAVVPINSVIYMYTVSVPSTTDKKLNYRRGTARYVVSIEILPIATQQCRNYLNDKS